MSRGDRILIERFSSTNDSASDNREESQKLESGTAELSGLSKNTLASRAGVGR